MSEKDNKKPKPGTDDRSFIELWYSMPEVARGMVVDYMRGKGFTKQAVYKWAHGSVPKADTIKILRRGLGKLFGLKTIPYILFPSKSERQRIEERFNPSWDGRVDWPSLRDDDENTNNE